MVVDSQSDIVFRQALDSGSVKEACVSIPNQTTVGQRIKSKIGGHLRINRYRLRNSAGRTERAGSSWPRRHHITGSVALPLTDGFVIAENECLAFSDRSSAGGPELVAMKWRYLSGVEVVSRIEGLI